MRPYVNTPRNKTQGTTASLLGADEEKNPPNPALSAAVTPDRRVQIPRPRDVKRAAPTRPDPHSCIQCGGRGHIGSTRECLVCFLVLL